MSYSININSFTIQRKLGNGAFANVYLILDKNNGKFYAAKILTQKYDKLSDEGRKDLKREISVGTKLNHPAVIKYIGFSPFDFNRKRYPMIVMEYLPNKTLTDIIDLERSGTSPQLWDSTKKLINIYGIASAMSYLHKNNIIHRDLKPDNILMDQYLFPKVADFGLSKNIDTDKTTVFKGTYAYSSPEAIGSRIYSFASDVYSYSLIIYEIITNKQPYQGISQINLLVKLANKERPEIDSTVPESYKQLIQKCWAENPEERPTFDDILHLLESDEGFITDTVDSNEFYKYIDYINLQQSSSFNGDLDTNLVDQYLNSKDISFESIQLVFKEKIKEPEKIVETEENNNEEEDDFEEIDIIAQGKNYSKEEIANLYKKSADKGNLYAMVKYGEMMFNGEGIKENKEEAAEYFKMASDFGNLEGMTNYANALITGQGVPEDKVKAVELFKKASYKGNLKATVYYGDSLLNGNGIQQNKEKAIQMYKRAADKGEIDGIIKYANHLYNGDGIAENKIEAIKMYQKAADKGDTESMFFYATIMFSGVDVPADKNEAARYFKMAADLGHIKSILNIAFMLNYGYGIKQDIKESYRYYKIAANKGNLEAMHNQATILYNNIIQIEQIQKLQNNNNDKYVKIAKEILNPTEIIDVEENLNKIEKINEIIRLISYAADKGNLNAINKYASLLYKGDIIEKNEQRAIELYKMAAEAGNADAMNIYANILLEKNCGNTEIAIDYIKKAADKGNKFAALSYVIFLEKHYPEFVENNRSQIKQYLKIAADQNNSFAAYHYGQYLLQENDKEEAMKYFEMASLFNKEACYLYGKNLYFGETCPPDDEDKAILYIYMGGASFKNDKYICENTRKKSNLLHSMIKYSKSCNIY